MPTWTISRPINDRYGYIQASELIKITGEIIYEEVNASTARTLLSVISEETIS